MTNNRLCDFRLPRWDEMPSIALYLDQVLIIVESAVKAITPENEKIITPMMINNYVKQKVITPTVKKRYSKEHLADLIMITMLKRVLSTAEIVLVLNDLKGGGDTKPAYETFCAAVESCLREEQVELDCPQISLLAVKSLAYKIRFDLASSGLPK